MQKLLPLLRKCISSKSFVHGKLLHQKSIICGLQNNILLCKNLINFYVCCSDFISAQLVFDNIENPLDITLWNGLMAVYTKNYMYREAVELFERLQSFSHIKPDNYTYPNALKAYGNLGFYREGKKIHAHVLKCGFIFDVVVASSLVRMYAKCKLLNFAIKVFDEMPERDAASWNTVISCYSQDGQYEKALQAFDNMKNSGPVPDSVTFATVFSACSKLLTLEFGRKIHEDLKRTGFVFDDFVSSALIDMYAKCGSLYIAREVFEEIHQKPVVCWNSIIGGYALIGDSDTCMELFSRMKREGINPNSTTLSSFLSACSKSSNSCLGKFAHGFILRNYIEADIFINSSLIDLYFKCGNARSAKSIFVMISKTNVVLWNVMISGYVLHGLYFEALKVFDDMKAARVRPDAITFTSILPACSQLAALEQGKEIHGQIIDNNLESNEIVMAALLDMYAKCGSVDDARRIFDKLPVRDFVSWTSMITAYGSHGRAKEALNIFEAMQETNAQPDRVTFLSVISACGHGGLVDEGYHYFNLMTNKYGIEPEREHYSCLIDLLGRAGRLHEAYDLIQNTPSIRNDIDILSSLLFACNLKRDLKTGDKIAQVLGETNHDDPSIYISLSNMYASANRWQDVRKARAELKGRRLRKNPGCSWIEIEKRIHQFFVDDNSHPQLEMVYQCLASLIEHMEKEDPTMRRILNEFRNSKVTNIA